MKQTRQYSGEVRERAVRLVLEHERHHDSQTVSAANRGPVSVRALFSPMQTRLDVAVSYSALHLRSMMISDASSIIVL